MRIKHKQRVEKVKEFTDKNKLFTIIALVVTLYMAFSFISSKLNKDDKNSPDISASQSETADEAVEEYNDKEWHFYWIDLWVFLIGGGFCTVMIFREKRKAREKLK